MKRKPITIKDSRGNVIASIPEEPFGSVRLTLYSRNNMPRLIGIINPHQRIMYLPEKYAKNQKNSAKKYKFNHKVMTGATLFDYVVIKNTGSKPFSIKIPNEFILTYGETFGREDDFTTFIFLDIKLINENFKTSMGMGSGR